MAVDPCPWHCGRCLHFNSFVRPQCDWCGEEKTVLEEERTKILEQQNSVPTKSYSEILEEIVSNFGHNFDTINPEEFVENLRSD